MSSLKRRALSNLERQQICKRRLEPQYATVSLAHFGKQFPNPDENEDNFDWDAGWEALDAARVPRSESLGVAPLVKKKMKKKRQGSIATRLSLSPCV